MLSAAEMNGDAIWVYIADNTSGCVPFTCTLYTVASTLDEIKALVDDLESRLTAARAGYLDNINNTALATTVAQTADHTANIAAIKAKTDNLPSDPADQSAVEAAITAAHSTTNGKIDAVDDYVDTEIGAIITHLTDLKGETFDSATDSNEAIRNQGDAAWATATGFSTFNPATDTVARVTLVDTTTTNTDMVAAAPSAASIADAVLDEAMAGHVAAGSLGKAVADVLEDTATTLPAAIDAVDNFVDTEIATLDGKLDDLLEALVYKMVITEADGATELFDASNTSKGSIAAAFVSDSGYTTRKKLVL